MKLMETGALSLLGLSDDGSKTAELWGRFDEKSEHASGTGYEVRFFQGEACRCFVGMATDRLPGDGWEALSLPASEYAVFDVKVANGYDSENQAMDQWLLDNSAQYRQREWNGQAYALEIYGPRFQEGIVEIYLPVVKQ